MSMPRVISSVPWSTRAKPPTTTYLTRRRSSAWRTPYGSNRGRLSAIAPSFLELGQESTRASLGREVAVLVEPVVERGIPLSEHEGDLEAAGFDDGEEVVDARRDFA